ncbi:TlpA family protein disulfide reductase [Peptoniphilus sp. MSJ-1]|uniref:TlpA family protein disulfide reductase n=1 Tax=Peptoniphilus ovalis TaxID=2841503 RepID=A0ABS6FIZ1_9FIRM|nr:TlpA disulfide reductase family protein [Peptoniphilus ovalis]MBU5670148.1 TlpA family protein disulfide reductase [Peptoniphilus ovalis]
MKKFTKIMSILMISMTLFACSKKEPTEIAGTNTTKNSQESTNVTNKANTIDLIERPFETFNFQTIDIKTGEIVKSEDVYNKPYTMINIWATYCGPCKKELPDLQKLYENYGDKINILGIVADTNANMTTNVEEALAIMKDAGVEYVNIMPNPTMEEDMSKITAFPTTIFVDDKGNVVGGYLGAYEYDRVAATIDELLK